MINIPISPFLSGVLRINVAAITAILVLFFLIYEHNHHKPLWMQCVTLLLVVAFGYRGIKNFRRWF
jgi:hypothetical protein